MNPALFALSSGVSVVAMLASGIQAKKQAEVEAFNLETQRVMNKAIATQRANDRLEEWRMNVSGNIAAFALAGRDISSDRSIKAFMDAQKEKAAEDVDRIATSDTMDGLVNMQNQAARRSEGRAAMFSAVVGALGTGVDSYYKYQQIKV